MIFFGLFWSHVHTYTQQIRYEVPDIMPVIKRNPSSCLAPHTHEHIECQGQSHTHCVGLQVTSRNRTHYFKIARLVAYINPLCEICIHVIKHANAVCTNLTFIHVQLLHLYRIFPLILQRTGCMRAGTV